MIVSVMVVADALGHNVHMASHGRGKKIFAKVRLDAGTETVLTLDPFTGNLAGCAVDRLNGRLLIQ